MPPRLELTRSKRHRGSHNLFSKSLLDLDREVPDYFDESPRMSSNRMEEVSDRKHDVMANAESRPQSLNDYLLEQLHELELEPQLLRMCERIISALDATDGGYLKTSLSDLLPISATAEDQALAEDALEIVQSLDPPGIAARGPRARGRARTSATTVPGTSGRASSARAGVDDLLCGHCRAAGREVREP